MIADFFQMLFAVVMTLLFFAGIAFVFYWVIVA